MGFVEAILTDSLWRLGLFGLVVATVAGIWLVVAPANALTLASRLNREYSIRWLQRALDTPRTTEPFIYRHHTVVGPLLIAATGYFFWQYFTRFDADALAAMYQGVMPQPLLEAVAAAVTLVLVIGNALGAALGFIILLRPSLLKGTESWANRWVSSEKVNEILDRRIDRPEGFAHQYPRRVGAGILLAAGYILVIALAVGR